MAKKEIDKEAYEKMMTQLEELEDPSITLEDIPISAEYAPTTSPSSPRKRVGRKGKDNAGFTAIRISKESAAFIRTAKNVSEVTTGRQSTMEAFLMENFKAGLKHTCPRALKVTEALKESE